MPTYYEALNLQPTATTVEIESAIESQYNQWRRLVTHHDPAVVNQANQALQGLETIRMTLTNPSSRSIYDAGIGVSGAIGGLADPDAILRQYAPLMTPPAPPRQAPPATAQSAPSAKSNLWICPQCHTENPAQTRFCFKCGSQLVRECPECKQMASLVATGFCGACGYKYEVALQRADLAGKINSKQQQLAQLEAQLRAAESDKNSAELVVRKHRRGLLTSGVFTIIWLILRQWVLGNGAVLLRFFPVASVGSYSLLLLGVEAILLLFAFVAAVRCIGSLLRLTPALRNRGRRQVAFQNLAQDSERTRQELDHLNNQRESLALQKGKQ